MKLAALQIFTHHRHYRFAAQHESKIELRWRIGTVLAYAEAVMIQHGILAEPTLDKKQKSQIDLTKAGIINMIRTIVKKLSVHHTELLDIHYDLTKDKAERISNHIKTLESILSLLLLRSSSLN